MKNFYLKSCLLLLSFWGYSQSTGAQKTYFQIPPSYQSHPELGKTTHNLALHQVDYELVQNRTQYSRTFLNTNTTKTTVQSSVPLHYQGDDGNWYSIDYKLSKERNKIVYPVQNPFFELDGRQTVLKVDNQSIKIKDQTHFVFVSAANTVVEKISSTKREATIEKDNEIVFGNIAPNVDKIIALYQQAMKYNYTIRNAAFLPQHFESMLVEESITLPNGFSMQQDADNRIVIVNSKGEEVMMFHQPVISDSKALVRNQRPQPYEAKYGLVRLNETDYKIQIKIDGSWLQSTDRVFPINIDPVVTVSNTDIVNSCSMPNYQQAILQVAVPAGETILSTNISYDFVAVTGSTAWMADQRSFVSGPSGQTPVTNGTGSTAGMQTYHITDSPIANMVSTGLVDFTFNFARSFGGSGCNATYNFVNRREVAVTYGTIVFGNGPLVINEYCASNRNFNDGFGRNEDWIELFNSSPDTYLNLTGYYLSNNINNPTKWQMTGGVIPPNSRVLVFCSNRNIATGTVLHASFDLSQTDGDQVVVANPAGTIVDSQQMYVTQTNHSYGRTTDGAATWSVFKTPTPGTTNTNGYAAQYSSKPTLSMAPGKYTSAITVAMSSAGTNEQIRYTTNGATPTATSTLYSGPISVTTSKVIRARSFSSDLTILPGFIETNTYFINENSSLPVVSISGDADLTQLLGGTTLEPTGYFEYFETNGSFIDETMGDFDKHGNDSWAYDQRGIDFIARDDHGYKKRLEHQFFNTTERSNFRRLILKAAGSDNFPGQTGGAHMRDVFAQRLSELGHLELDERRSTFISLFVNGQYWGIYDLREKVDDNQYTDYYYDQDYLFRDSDNYLQYIKTWGTTEPEFGNQPAITAWDSLMAYVQNNDMSIDANYNYVESQLNIDSLVDYFVLNSYLVNKDWLNWNTSWWRGLDPAGGAKKWRYALWDVDGILGHYINYTGIPDITANATPCQAESLDVGVGHAQTIEKLVTESPIVRQKYITRYADLLSTHLSCTRATQVYDSIVAVIAPEIPRQIQRWGGNLATWQANVQAGRNFLLTRCSQTINTGLVSCYNVTGPYAVTFDVIPAGKGKIKMNSEWLVNYPFNANIFGDISTILKGEPAADGYEFGFWIVDGAVILPEDLTNPDIALLITQAASVTAVFKEIPASAEAVHYWHFNTLDAPSAGVVTVPADFTLITGASPLMTYTGTGAMNIDENNNGSEINLHFNQPAGRCARIRNPSDGRSIVFDLPSTGYENLKFGYAVQRTNEGQLANNVFYTVDGINYSQVGLSQVTFTTTTDFTLVDIDLTGIAEANNNPDFKIKVTFTGNTTGENGNNRFDNVSLMGFPIPLSVISQEATAYQVFPNPFTNNIQIISNEPMTELSIYDIIGKNVWKQSHINKDSQTIDLSSLNAGVYLLKIKTPSGLITHKLVKQ